MIVSLLVGLRRHPRLLADPGPALDPGAADRRPAGARPGAEPAPQGRSTWSLSALLGLGGLALVLIGLFGGGSAGAAAGAVGGGGAGDRPRRLALQPAAGAAAGRGLRLAAREAAPADRPAGARERAAQPEPHRGHRGGADDRPRAGRLRHRLRRRPEELGRPGRRRKLRRRDRDPEHRRLLADPGGGRDRRRARCRASNRWPRSARPSAKLLGGGSTTDVSAPSPEHRRSAAGRMEARAGRRPCAAWATTKRSSPTPSPPTTASRSATASGCSRQTGSQAALPGRRRVRLEARPASAACSSPSRSSPATSPRRRIATTSSSPSRAPTPTTVQALLTRGCRSGLPDHRSAQPAGTEGKP